MIKSMYINSMIHCKRLARRGGRHGSDVQLREALEPLFVKHGVDAVFTGHERYYERLKPQQGVHYFISGRGGKLHRGDNRRR